MTELASPDAPIASPARAMRSRLRDMEDHLDQMTPALVRGADGRLYLAAASLLPQQVDLEPYPFLSPRSRLPGLDDTADETLLDFTNAAALSRLEARLNDYGQQQLEDSTGQNMLARANPIAFEGHPFQIAWAGSRREWHLTGGTLFWHERNPQTQVVTDKSHTYPDTWLTGTSGALVLPVQVQPFWQPDNPVPEPASTCILTPTGPPRIVPTPRQDPPKISWTLAGIHSAPGYSETPSWTAGNYQIILARLQAPGPSNRTPVIRQFVSSNLDFLGSDWSGSRNFIFTA